VSSAVFPRQRNTHKFPRLAPQGVHPLGYSILAQSQDDTDASFSAARLRVLRFYASVFSHLARPSEKTQNLHALAPGKTAEFDKADPVHPDSRVGFQTPAQIGAPPWRQVMAASRVPQKSQNVPHRLVDPIVIVAAGFID
jgi:hypothetical protein